MTGLEPRCHRGGVATARSWDTFAERLTADLVDVGQRFDAVLEGSSIRYINPNTADAFAVFLGAADWGWEPNEALIPQRTALLADFLEWFARFRLLHRTPLPEVQERIRVADELVRRWLSRDDNWDRSIPQTTVEARKNAATTVADLDRLSRLASGGGGVGAVQVARRGGPPGRGGHRPGDRVAALRGKSSCVERPDPSARR
jgi:hypothetical protein